MKLNREKITILLCLLLIALCSTALLTTVHVRDNMAKLTDKALAVNVSDDHPACAAEIQPLIESITTNWQTYEPVVSTYSRHDEVERVSSAVRKLRPLCDAGRYAELRLTLCQIQASLDHLLDTELPTVSNIL